MFILLSVVFWIFCFLLFWGMVGYPISLKILLKFHQNKTVIKNYDFKPTVTVMIVAHNEEKVILQKLENIVKSDYPKELFEVLVTSDNSTDQTNEIVEKFMKDHPEYKVSLYKTKEHKGKTNAQNEAQKKANGDILVMSDANSMFAENAVSELVATFSDEKIVYVTGRLKYVASEDENATAMAESTYWEGDLQQRSTESLIYTITAGNGAIYACRNSYYVDFPLIECHDSAMPKYYGERGLRAIYNPDAIACEKAGQNDEDEFKRKVRMNRYILRNMRDGIKYANVFKYGWFSYFYFGHRFCRYVLWLAHIMIFLASGILALTNLFYAVIFALQILFYLYSIITLKSTEIHGLLKMPSYYCLALGAQIMGVFNIITGKTKPTWDKAESTR